MLPGTARLTLNSVLTAKVPWALKGLKTLSEDPWFPKKKGILVPEPYTQPIKTRKIELQEFQRGGRVWIGWNFASKGGLS